MTVACLTISCCEIDKRANIDHQDTIELLNLALGGKQFNKLFQESRIQNKSVYIALDSTDIRWPKKAGNIQIELIAGYNKKPDVFQRGNEKRFVINPPIFEFVNDSAKVSVYVFKFHLNKEFKFAKSKDKWLLVSDNEYQY
ncbi:hypothetical protein [Pedobacter psychroterrae]|uniref:Uncharacterized protein n=1 Tax=Pedobacter psychroterrae TaxID=2530453 RepID=A0A4R0NKW0_9SPHI|nr:hypothetical protein [Pedobacter psychroterrae]TCC99943.1 hypothetical protein EZ437_17035 [Pedobacter psychroterrae]